jgi:hypothetical protein
MGDQNLLSKAPPCFERYVKPLVQAALQAFVPTPVSRRVVIRQAADGKNNCQIFIIIITLLMSPLLRHRPSLWITHKENSYVHSSVIWNPLDKPYKWFYLKKTLT